MIRLAAILALLAGPAMAADPYGRPFAIVNGTVCKIHDADTFRVCDQRGSETKIRLRGIDAPEVTRRSGVTDAEIAHGQAARDWMRERFDGKPVSCALLGVNNGRMVADCWIGESLGEALIESGLVRACPAYGGGYVTAPEADGLPGKEYCE